jgi:malonyl-CoA O-methyltransferase
MTPERPTRPLPARRLRRAAADFGAAAFLHAQAREELLRRLEPVKLTPKTVLDLGGGPGVAARLLADHYRKASVTLVDRSPTMLEQAARRRGWWRRFECLEADATALPLADASVDLVYANFLLPYLAEPADLFDEVRRVLKPRGYFVFSTLGAGTLEALKEVFAAVDHRPHVIEFQDFHDVGDALSRSGFVAPVLDAERLTVTYRDLKDLCRDLRVSAAPLPANARKTLTGTRRWAAATAEFARRRQADGRVPVGCELVYGQAWAPDPDAPARRTERSEVVVPLANLRRR